MLRTGRRGRPAKEVENNCDRDKDLGSVALGGAAEGSLGIPGDDLL